MLLACVTTSASHVVRARAEEPNPDPCPSPNPITLTNSAFGRLAWHTVCAAIAIVGVSLQEVHILR